jgi:hypothetical protein
MAQAVQGSRAAAETGLESAARQTRQETMGLAEVERMVVKEIEAWERDRNAAHLLRAIERLQDLVRMTAGLAGVAAAAVGQCAGSTQAGRPGAPAGRTGGYSQASGSVGGGAGANLAADAPPGAIKDAAGFAKRQMHQTTEYVRQTAERTQRILQDALKSWREGGLRAGAGFEGRASGGIGPAGTQAGGFGGRTGGPTQGPAGAGFAGRTSGNIR